MAKNYIILEVHDDGEWPRIAPENLMQHVDVRLPAGLTLTGAKVSEDAEHLVQYRQVHEGCGGTFRIKAYSMYTLVCSKCRKEHKENSIQHDPDHLNPAKGGNRAGDDYWSER